MGRRRAALLALAAAGACALVVWGLRDDRGGRAPPGSAAASAPTPPGSVAPAAPPALPPRPASLAGTDPDGALVTDADGRFVPTRDALDLFDYYFAASGEEPDAVIVARIEREIRARLDPPDDALALLDDYLAYRGEVRRLFETEGLDALPLERRLQRLREIRRGSFGAALAESLFGEEEARVRAALAWRRTAVDPTLAPDEREARLAALASEWPEAVRERRARATAAQRLLADEAALRAEGVGASEIQARREQAFGAEAAQRLAALDRARASWEARVAAYRLERAALEGEIREPARRAAAVEALRAERFAGAERLRVRALEATWAEAAAGAPEAAAR